MANKLVHNTSDMYVVTLEGLFKIRSNDISSGTMTSDCAKQVVLSQKRCKIESK